MPTFTVDGVGGFVEKLSPMSDVYHFKWVPVDDNVAVRAVAVWFLQ